MMTRRAAVLGRSLPNIPPCGHFGSEISKAGQKKLIWAQFSSNMEERALYLGNVGLYGTQIHQV
jgi:hypothetical protein